MKKRHIVYNVRFRQGKLCLVVDGAALEYPLAAISSRLESASKLQRETFDISPGGYGIHWPLLDEDLSIDGLLHLRPTQTLQPAASRPEA